MTSYQRPSPEAMAAYRATAQRRQAEADEQVRMRRERAWAVARRAAALLREEFGAGRVVLFGSLVHDVGFTATSDIDLGAWGLPPEEFFLAVAHLQDLSPEFQVDLVPMERCKPAIRDVVVREGVPL